MQSHYQGTATAKKDALEPANTEKTTKSTNNCKTNE